MSTPLDVIEGRARWCVVEGDSADVLASLPPASCSALVTDPPAGIGFMGREWDKDKGGRAQWVAWLASVLGLARVAVRPGGRAFVWALPRTTHWTGCAVEDAGWAVETVVTHLFGTGWPKGASQLKPSSEHWYLARTGPSTGLNVDGCRVTASGPSPSIARREVAARTGNTPAGKTTPGGWEMRNTAEHYTAERPGEAAGRWPPNTLFTHSPGCERVGERRVQTTTGHKANGGAYARGEASTYGAGLERDGTTCYVDPDGTELVEAWRCVEGCPVAELDAQSGDRPSTLTGRADPRTTHANPGKCDGRGYGGGVGGGVGQVYADAGPASRFFPCFPADDPAAPFAYIAKPSRAEKDAGTDDLPSQRGPVMNAACVNCGKGKLDGRRAGPCCSRPEYTSAAPRGNVTNHHPTVKPVALMRWLLRLITEPGDIVLDPFGGSGTTGVAALLEGRRVILVERDPAFAAICRARLSHAAPTAATLTARVAEPIAAPAPDFGPLFGPR